MLVSQERDRDGYGRDVHEVAAAKLYSQQRGLISANQRCNLLPFVSLKRMEGLDELWIGCRLGRMWVVFVESGGVQDGTVTMVSMLQEFLACNDSCVHNTKKK